MLPMLLRRRRGWTEPFTEMERVFGDLARPWWGRPESGEEARTGAYPVDIREEDGRLIVDAEMPGFSRDEIDVNLEGDVLRITAERKAEEGEGTSHLKERRFTRVERAFTLPAPVEEAEVQAKLDSGVLHLEMPMTKEKAAKQIEIT